MGCGHWKGHVSCIALHNVLIAFSPKLTCIPSLAGNPEHDLQQVKFQHNLQDLVNKRFIGHLCPFNSL